MASFILNPNPTVSRLSRLYKPTLFTKTPTAVTYQSSPASSHFRLSHYNHRLTAGVTPSLATRHTITSPTSKFKPPTQPTRTMATSNLPDKMSSVQISRNGGPEVLTHSTSTSVPTLKEGHVLVRNTHAGVNFIDTYFRTGLYATPPENFPLTLGREAAGTVAAVHPSASPSFSPGDSVVYMSPAGAYATYSSVPAAHVLRLPEGLSPETAAASLLQGLTAWTFIREAAEVKKGDAVLVHAAAGGVGGLLVQMIAGAVEGATIIAVARGKDKCQLAKAKGAHHVVDTSDAAVDLVEEVKKLTDGKGVDAIFDGVGKATFEADLAMAARKGRIVSFGNASGAVPPVDILRLGPKNLKLMRPVVNNYVAARDELERYSTELFDLIVAGKVEVPVWKTYALADAAQAHIDLESRKTTGKLLLKID